MRSIAKKPIVKLTWSFQNYSRPNEGIEQKYLTTTKENNYEMVDLNVTISIITLNGHGPNAN